MVLTCNITNNVPNQLFLDLLLTDKHYFTIHPIQNRYLCHCTCFFEAIQVLAYAKVLPQQNYTYKFTSKVYVQADSAVPMGSSLQSCFPFSVHPETRNLEADYQYHHYCYCYYCCSTNKSKKQSCTEKR